MKRFLPFFLCLLVIYSFLIIPQVHAQGQNMQDFYTDTKTDPSVPHNLHTWTQNVMLEVIAAMDCQLMGTDPLDKDTQCLGIDPKTHQIGYVKNSGGLVSLTTQGIAYMYATPVITTNNFLTYVQHEFGLNKTAYAATTPGTDVGGQTNACNFGIGFCGLSPLTKIWSTFRDFIYLFFIFLFTIVGLGIMLRIKVDPRTVMTIQNRIPDLIIKLITITFSLGIAGLMVDLMYVATSVILNLYTPALPNFAHTNGANINILSMNAVESQNVIGYFMGLYSTKPIGLITGATGGFVNSGFFNLWTSGAQSVSTFSAGTFPGQPWDFVLGSAANITLAFMGRNFGLGGLIQLLLQIVTLGGAVEPFGIGLAGTVNLGPAAQVANVIGNMGTLFALDHGSLGSLIGLIIIPIALLLALFRILIQLIKAYVGILVKVALAPFMIIAPGENGGFMGWIKSLASDLAIFPVTLFLLLLGEVFTMQFGHGPEAGVLFIPPLIGANNPESLGPMISLGILFIIPNAGQLIQEAIKAPQSKALGGIGKSLGAGNPMSMLSQVGSLGYTMSTLGTLPILNRIKLFENMAKRQGHFGHAAVPGRHG